jgi:hypothetical protein
MFAEMKISLSLKITSDTQVTYVMATVQNVDKFEEYVSFVEEIPVFVTAILVHLTITLCSLETAAVLTLVLVAMLDAGELRPADLVPEVVLTLHCLCSTRHLDSRHQRISSHLR